MTFQPQKAPTSSDPTTSPVTARDWVKVLATYREPNQLRSAFELGISLFAFVVLWALAVLALPISYWLSFAISVVNALFLVRIFAIQHDCGHGSFFKNRTVSDWIGRGLGVITLTPYDVWRRCHSIHHSNAGNLDKRGIGDINTITVDEYMALSSWGKLMYRLYRHPITLFAIGPIYLFIFSNRLPMGLMKSGAQYWVSAMGTNVALAVALLIVYYFGGLAPIMLIFLPSTIIAASIGVWLFYVQHQFESTSWKHNSNWQVHEAALEGSSHYDLPPVLRWMTANIGIHHVHHLYSRIPFYRLTEVLNDHKILVEAQRLTLVESLKCVHFSLWDEKTERLMSFASAKAQYG